jgi:hypothetical protein
MIGTDLFAARDIELPDSLVEQLNLPAPDLDRIPRGNARLLHLKSGLRRSPRPGARTAAGVPRAARLFC